MSNIQLVMGCVHAPFHNKKLWKGVSKLIQDIKPNGINLIGDILDVNSLSFHERGKIPLDGMNIRWEYKEANKFFDELDNAIGKRKVDKNFIYGNHEGRYLRHLELPDNKRIIAESPEEACRLYERGYNVKTDWKNDYVTLGSHLQIFHGELLGVNPAKSQLDKLKQSCMFAHSHRAGIHLDGNMGSYNIGGLFDKESSVFRYASRLVRRNWINGFGLVNIDDSGYYFAQLITAYNDTFYYAGKKYGG